MFRNFVLEIFLILLIFLVVLSMIPLIELKYHSDLYETIENFNKYCLNNDADLINDLDVKDTYMWNMGNYLYDFDTVDGYFKKKVETESKDADTETEDAVTETESKLYLYYLKMSIAFLLVMLVFFIYVIIIYNYEICITESDDIQIKEYLRYCGYALFIYVLLFIIFFSLILKKTTELYKKEDTLTYEYIMLMKSLDIILKENKMDKPDNKTIIDILKNYSKNKINDIGHVAINNKNAMYELKIAQEKKIKSAEKVYDNYNIYLIKLKNIDRLAYYNSDESKNKVKDKVADIFRFIYAYVIFLIAPIYILSISLKGNYIYLLGTIIAIIIFSVTVYNIYNTLQ